MASTTHPMFAVLIGIDDYENAANLKGPSQDLKLMGALCDRLGVGADQRKVLSGAGARVSEIQAAFDWLEAALDDEKATALVHFSGHGTLFNQAGLQESLALAAHDFVPNAKGTPTEQGVITLADLASRFGAPDAGAAKAQGTEQEATSAFIDKLAHTKLARITVVLDCCWNQAGVSTTSAVQMPLLTYRMLVGCTRDDVAKEIQMDGVYVGAFTWALTTAMSRWQVVELEGNRQMTVSHSQLMSRVDQLLSALGVKGQTPMIAGPRILDEIPVFQRSVDWNSGAVVSEEPDVVDEHRQLWGGEDGGSLTYRLQWRRTNTDTWATFAQVTARNVTNDENEYWSFDPDETWRWLNYTQNHAPSPQTTGKAQLRIQRRPDTTQNPLQPFSVNFTAARETTPGTPSEPTAGNQIYTLTSGSSTEAIFQLVVSPKPNSPDYILKQIQWWTSAEKSDSTFDPTFGSPDLSVGGSKTYSRLPSPSISGTSMFPAKTIPSGKVIEKPQPPPA